MSSAEEVKEERERSREWNAHNVNWQAGQVEESFEAEKAKWLDRLQHTEMSDAGINMLDNMVDQTFILGNLTGAEVNEIQWRLHTMFLKIKDEFPPAESDLQGTYRSYIFDDTDENLTALSGQQEIIISQMLIGVSVYVSRSKDGFQQEMNVQTINVSEVRNPEQENNNSSWRGLFS